MGADHRSGYPQTSRLVDWLVIVVLGVIAGTGYYYFRDLGLDDAYITYRVAENAAAGLGPVYNPGEHVQVSTTPLFSLLLAIAGKVHPDVPALGTLLSAGGLFGSAAFLYLWAKKVLGVIGGLICSLVYAAFPLALLTMGMETTVYLTFALGSLYFYSRRRLTLSAVLLALTTLTRADGVVLAGVVLIHYAATFRRLPYRQIVWYAALVAPWFLFAQFYYGSPFPNTLAAKMAHGQSFWWSRHFLEGAWATATQYQREDGLFSLFLAFAVMGALLGTRLGSQWWVLYAWIILYSAGYTLLGIPEYHWYYVPLIPALAYAVATGITRCARLLVSAARVFQGAGRSSATAVLSLALFAPLALTLARADFRTQAMVPDGRFSIYRDVGLWVSRNASANASAATVEIGTIGYYARRPIVDMIGLTHPDVARSIDGSDLTYAVRRYRPDYVVLGDLGLQDMQTQPWFGERYVPAKYFTHARYGPRPLVVYARVDPTVAGQMAERRANFDGRVDLRAYSINPRSVQPGEGFRLNLELWRTRPLERAANVYVHLVDAKGRTVSQRDILIGEEDWTAERMRQHLDLYIPPDVAPGKYEVQAGLYYLPGIERLPVRDQGSDKASDRLHLGTVKVAGLEPDPAPGVPLRADFAGKISLLGYDLDMKPENGTRSIEVRLYWQASAKMEDDFTVFVHLVDAQGKLVTQHDGQPQEGAYPTTIWDAGESVTDVHVLHLGDGSTAGEYLLAVGWYHGPTGRRLAARSPDARVADDAVLIERLRLR